jgi:Protein of unknown function (DUF2934)
MAILSAAQGEVAKAESPIQQTEPDTRESAGSNQSLPPSREDRIRDAAYRRYVERSDGPGNSVSDWLEAEAEIDAQGD